MRYKILYLPTAEFIYSDTTERCFWLYSELEAADLVNAVYLTNKGMNRAGLHCVFRNKKIFNALRSQIYRCPNYFATPVIKEHFELVRTEDD